MHVLHKTDLGVDSLSKKKKKKSPIDHQAELVTALRRFTKLPVEGAGKLGSFSNVVLLSESASIRFQMMCSKML